MAKKKTSRQRTVKKKQSSPRTSRPKYPRHSSHNAMRIPRAILDQNAGKACTDSQAAGFLGLKSPKGPFAVEISSAIKYGFLQRPSSGRLELTDTSRQILRPKVPEDEVKAYQHAVLNAPVISDVYKHYRGENLPDGEFLDNTLEDTFKVPKHKLSEFKDILLQSLESASLIETHDNRIRVLHSAADAESNGTAADYIEEISSGVSVKEGDTCFVVMPFASPMGEYFSLVYKPAIEKAGLTPIRADDEIFGAGKIMDQIWSGINAAKVLVAELTSKNPNVYYELGIAHALKKPVVLVSSNEEDVPFDLHHIRVIYYDVNDPFWGQKLLNKVAENIVSAIKNPEESIFKASEIDE